MPSVEETKTSDKISELKAALKALNQEYSKMKDIPAEERGDFGRKLNEKKQKIMAEIAAAEEAALEQDVKALDITAPCAINGELPKFLTADEGSQHPLMTELDRVISIYQAMGFDIVETLGEYTCSCYDNSIEGLTCIYKKKYAIGT